MADIKLVGAYTFRDGNRGFIMNTPKGREVFVGSKNLLIKELKNRLKKLTK
ncbi:MAG: hypothetical protein J5608_00280 [Alphaproteobacteria bacterium]|nr:hypothetical protein [Alphaproteobacteria bacterium]